MNRYHNLFSRLEQERRGAFIPFVTLGDPDPETSLRIIKTLIDAGADALELGIPFSDPLADGPTIQNANLRALTAGVTPDVCFDLLAEVRRLHPDIPMGLLLYANLVYRRGLETFYLDCAAAGVDSVLVADVPRHEAAPFRTAALAAGIDPVFICPPNADDACIRGVAEAGRGYTYLLARPGVTGTERQAEIPLEGLISGLTRHGAPPLVQGFGISAPDQVRAALDAGAQGAISGSAVVRIIEEQLHDTDVMLERLGDFVRAMKAATLPA